MNSNWKSLALAVVLAAGSSAASADLISDAADVGPGANVLSFERGVDGMVVNDAGGADTAIVVNFTTTGGDRYIGTPFGLWPLGSNGFWTTARTFGAVDGGVATDGSVASMVFDFGGLTVQRIGGFLNFDPDFLYGDASAAFPLPLYIAAYGADGSLLEGQDLPVFTPADENGVEALDQGAFFGFSRQSADIAKFVISGPYAVVDDLTFTTPVPEPSTYALFATGLLLAGAAARRRARTRA